VKFRPPPIRKQAKKRVRPRGMGNTMPPSSGKRNPLSSMPSHSVTRATPKLEQKAQQVRKYFSGVILSLYNFIKISRDGRGAVGSTSNSKFKDTDS